ncbi:hypothetical protein LZG04_40670 [Saccharothrix sp. S26]|uniref:hypothetical protein n=1 Tax=Saccharothrix sp. S26 TaxID=2907215 RepID=UPI001F27854F|nr:hypothetical protein [Saccharothrix sp. S26]MCE7001090.1 hypothetical protein [Saccharothrix sp. S26]
MDGNEENPVEELQRLLEVLDQAAPALLRSLSIIVTLVRRHGSRTRSRTRGGCGSTSPRSTGSCRG